MFATKTRSRTKARTGTEERIIIDLTEDATPKITNNDSALKTTSEEDSSSVISSNEKSYNISNGSGLASICCAICLDAPTDLSATPCGHLFCLSCIHRAIGRGICPVCRQHVNRQRILPLEIMLAPNKSE
ncbi:unnamed protein product [Pneumocystis jirovecii]|uniref:RING-type domain-containing protein n=2 Tax=Pneumocystis jirovecii TaxID=42068 RepID=L0P9H2_PNEJI|nr:uncharacterized protein T551_02650 [Pneumocystis jirovecii RU7]KTW28231.1 hypothetical protein T551_02650 [Pneumocystis jirovecii RU7]CCJ29041.1 unnamed protein product [Pneumocystis jirovecii]